MAEQSGRALTTGAKEYVKQYFVYDVSNRMTDVYEARANARDGEPALRTSYTYIGVTNNVQAMKEAESLWDSDWDIV